MANDTASVDAQRRADIMSGRAPIPKLACHYCGFRIGKGALWCCEACARDYEAERCQINPPAPA
jgi:hypothetical protein